MEGTKILMKEIRNAHKIFFGKLQGTKQFGRGCIA